MGLLYFFFFFFYFIYIIIIILVGGERREDIAIWLFTSSFLFLSHSQKPQGCTPGQPGSWDFWECRSGEEGF